MIEDDVYRASSQYRYWSYTKESLARIRQNTNELASGRVRAAFRRVQAAKLANNGNEDNSTNGEAVDDMDIDIDVQTLTVHEELKIVEWGCSKITDMGEAMNPRIPSTVVVCLPSVFRSLYLSFRSNVCVVQGLSSHFLF